VTWLAGTASYLHHHRDLTHGVVGAPLLALAAAGALRLGLAGARFLPLLGCSLLGAGLHVLMDLWTSYGTRALSPFDRTWYAWDTVFIVDPWVLLLLGAGLVAWRSPQLARQLASLSLGLVAAYVGARFLLHAQAVATARERVPRAVRLAALPHPLSPLRWRIIADTGPDYWIGTLSLEGDSPPLARRPKRSETPAVGIARRSEVAAIFLDFSRFPWLEVADDPEGTAVTWSDLRFDQAGRAGFVTRVVVAPDGRIRSQAFRF